MGRGTTEGHKGWEVGEEGTGVGGVVRTWMAARNPAANGLRAGRRKTAHDEQRERAVSLTFLLTSEGDTPKCVPCGGNSDEALCDVCRTYR